MNLNDEYRNVANLSGSLRGCVRREGGIYMLMAMKDPQRQSGGSFVPVMASTHPLQTVQQFAISTSLLHPEATASLATYSLPHFTHPSSSFPGTKRNPRTAFAIRRVASPFPRIRYDILGLHPLPLLLTPLWSFPSACTQPTRPELPGNFTFHRAHTTRRVERAGSSSSRPGSRKEPNYAHHF